MILLTAHEGFCLQDDTGHHAHPSLWRSLGTRAALKLSCIPAAAISAVMQNAEGLEVLKPEGKGKLVDNPQKFPTKQT